MVSHLEDDLLGVPRVLRQNDDVNVARRAHGNVAIELLSNGDAFVGHDSNSVVTHPRNNCLQALGAVQGVDRETAVHGCER
jgi:hypothetical protein